MNESSMSLLHGDCLQALNQFPDKSIDAIITDPPYGIDYQSNRSTTRKDKIAGDKAPFVWFLPQAFRLLREGGCALVFCRWDTAEAFSLAMKWAGFTIKSSIVWDRGHHGMGDLRELLRRHTT